LSQILAVKTYAELRFPGLKLLVARPFRDASPRVPDASAQKIQFQR
jgi:hypothetical protein